MAVPRDLGYRMPAEWEPHAATWMAWPHNRETWPDGLGPVEEAWVAMVRAVVPGEAVHILVQDPETAARVRGRLGPAAERTVLHVVPTDDAWVRDTGPTFVVRPGPDPVAAVCWVFDAWGGKYPPWDRDAAVASRIAALAGVRTFHPGVVLEGGAVDPNGAGLLLATEACLLRAGRNPGLGRRDVEEILAAYLGIRRVLWLGEGIVGDDTDGHVDDVARFVGPATVVAAVEPDPTDPNHAPLEENLRRLRSFADTAGRPLAVVSLPMPEPLERRGGRLPASYANFYVANAAVLVPVFGQPRDRIALDTLRRLFPERRVVGIPAAAMVEGLGAVHCVTQQQPAAPVGA